MSPFRTSTLSVPSAFFKRLLQLIPDGILTWSPHSGVTQFSPQLRKMLGYPAEAKVCEWDEWLKLLHPDDRQNTTAQITESLLHPEDTFELEFRLKTFHGQYIDVACRGCIVQDPVIHKDLPHVVLSISDVSEQKETRDALEQTEMLYRTTVDNIRDMIFVVDRDLRVILMNRTMKRYLRANEIPDAEEGMPLEHLLEPYAPYYPESFERMFGESRTLRQEFNVELPTGIVWMEATQVPIRNADDEVVFILTTLHDITSRKKAEKERLKFESEALAQFHLSQLGLLASGLIHNLRNPLTILAMNTDLALQEALDVLERGEIDPQKLYDTLDHLADNLSGSKRGIQRLNDIVKEIQDFTRVNRDPSDSKPMEINSVLRADSKMISVDPDIRKKIEVRISLAKGPLYAYAPPSAISQIFLNLVNNGVEAMETSDTQVLSIRSGSNEDKVWFEVCDTGCGFPEEVKEQVGKPFISTKSDPSKPAIAGGGSGLGLYMATRALQRFGGHLEIQSEPGNTRIRILLPKAETSAEKAL